MEIIPVIDVMGGVVVRARMGQRDRYRPITTPLSPTSYPVDVARGLLSVHPFKTLYVADLDAIAGREDNRAVLMRLKAEFPQLTLWVDNGILVLGSETQVDATLVRHFAGDTRVTLSLDFRGPSFQGPPALLDDTDCWPQTVIAMTLARGGSGAGPDLDRLPRTPRAPPPAKGYGGGGGGRG